jgi:RNA polymerase sigma-70 factor (ECF subfamily)
VALFDQLREFLIERPLESDYARVAEKFNLRRNTIAVAVHRLRQRLSEFVRDELADTAEGTGDLDREFNALRNSLGAVIQ